MSNYFKEWKAQRAAEKSVIKQGQYFKFDMPTDPKNVHFGFAEELNVPRVCSSDTQRINMFSSHLSQTVHLVAPEYPKVFTNFENQFGEYSIAYKKADRPFKIIAKLEKNPLNYDLIVQYTDDGVYDVIHYRRAQHITEEYGYGVDDCLTDKKVGDVVKESEFVYKPPNYDEHGNFGYGVNLKATYLSWFSKTYEDKQ